MAQPPQLPAGTQVALPQRAVGRRRATAAEVEAWHEMARGWGPHDSGGEGWVSDGSTVVEIPAGTVVTVTRARCRSEHMWRTQSGYAEVALPSGERVKVHRTSLCA
jgi:hypothetical protein